MSEPNRDAGDPSRRALLLGLGMSAAVGALPRRASAQNTAETPKGRSDGRLTLGMILFERFQLLDVFGPLEIFGSLRDRVRIQILAERDGLIASSAGPRVAVDATLAGAPPLDILMVPGGGGTRREVENAPFVAAVASLARATPHVTSICTGAAILARTGLLDGVRAATNKRAYAWATSQGPKVEWVREARWVEDGKYMTSSGISAGTDMALALVAKLFGQTRAQRVADAAEYRWNPDPNDDPFARLNGLVN